jgi:hypothetical protein
LEAGKAIEFMEAMSPISSKVVFLLGCIWIALFDQRADNLKCVIGCFF